jgi:hypothetical protein
MFSARPLEPQLAHCLARGLGTRTVRLCAIAKARRAGDSVVSSPHPPISHASTACESSPGSGDRRIFVQIPAYRDPDLSATLCDLFAKAHEPELLRVSVLWQKASDDSIDRQLLGRPNLEIIEVPFEQSKGCGWARNKVQQMWRGEPYTLIMDSHHRFTPNWDQRLLRSFGGLVRDGVKKPILTAYMPPFSPKAALPHPTGEPLKVCPYERSNGLLLRLIGRPIKDWEKLSAPVPGNFVSLHFLFAGGEFNQEIQFDPNCYFRGDEVATSLRAFTSGYDVYHPHELIGWHCYQRDYRATHWEDHRDWSEQDMVSLRNLKVLLSGRYLNRYGNGRARNLQQFEDRLAIKLWDRT